MKNKCILLSYSFLYLTSCSQESSKITEIFSFPKKLDEVSAIETIDGSDKIWALQDSGNIAELYELDKTGAITNTVSINAENTDWEALTSDESGNLYIGDFGNNDNERKDLCIYKISNSDLRGKSAGVTRISFFYPEQKEFPPKKSRLFYDAEAFFYFKGNFYIFTKNRSSAFDGTTYIYKVPNKAGNHEARRIGEFGACGIYKQCAITSADISPDGKKAVILSANKVWLFEDFPEDKFAKGKITEIGLGHFSQKEGICFISDSVIYIADEKKNKDGGKLYTMDLNKR
jgi:hypothetical protein